MKRPTMTPVQSSNIKALGHDASGLFVQFKSGATYHYSGVPKAVFDAGLEAKSAGTWFAGAIKDREEYPHKKLEDD